MVVTHRAGTRDGNADALTRVSYPLVPCSAYLADIGPANVPCGGCHYCTRAHVQWAKFTEAYDAG